MNFDFVQFIVPMAFFFYAYVLLAQKPAYDDNRRGFPTKRARESEKIWNYVQRLAGIVCVVMGAVTLASTLVAWLCFGGSQLAYWVQMALKGICIVGIFPIVNIITNQKFPKKYPKKK